jgi:hypothetical protein
MLNALLSLPAVAGEDFRKFGVWARRPVSHLNRNKNSCFQRRRLHRLKFERRGFQIRRPLGQMEHLDPHDFFFLL